jgi:hypothetical protein
MTINLNENIKIWREFNSFELAFGDNSYDTKHTLAKLGFNKERIAIKDRWFDVLTPSELVRRRSKTDGYYRAVYIQIDWESGEYYIGKVNRPRWSELQRYQGSGLKFVNKFKKNRRYFARYYIAACETAEETEKLEASIVDKDLLLDEKCLNLVSGGAGTTKHPSIAESSEKKRKHMKSNPAQYKPMLEASKKAFQSGDTPALRERSRRIKEVMSTEEYSKASSERIKKWRKENPEKSEQAFQKFLLSIKTNEVQERKKASLKKYKVENPEKLKIWEKNRLAALAKKESKDKRKSSLKTWRANNPEQAKTNAQKRAKAAATKLSKEVCMVDIHSGNILNTFASLHEAAHWLLERGLVKNTNCVSSISSVCLRKPCANGGYRKKAYGYGWRFSNDVRNPSKKKGNQLNLFE